MGAEEFKASKAFPTHVGMNRSMWFSTAAKTGVPHARGDEPIRDELGMSVLPRSPRTWG
jgi:hypothetical protein